MINVYIFLRLSVVFFSFLQQTGLWVYRWGKCKKSWKSNIVDNKADNKADTCINNIVFSLVFSLDWKQVSERNNDPFAFKMI